VIRAWALCMYLGAKRRYINTLPFLSFRLKAVFVTLIRCTESYWLLIAHCFLLYIHLQCAEWINKYKLDRNLTSLRVVQFTVSSQTSQVADQSAGELVSSWMTPVIENEIKWNLTFPRHQHYQLHAHKAEEQNIHSRRLIIFKLPTET